MPSKKKPAAAAPAAATYNSLSNCQFSSNPTAAPFSKKDSLMFTALAVAAHANAEAISKITDAIVAKGSANVNAPMVSIRSTAV